MVTKVEVNESDLDGRFAVAAKTILDALKEISDQPLTFEVDVNSLEIKVSYQNGKYSLMGQNADEFWPPLWVTMPLRWKWTHRYYWVVSTAPYLPQPTMSFVP